MEINLQFDGDHKLIKEEVIGDVASQADKTGTRDHVLVKSNLSKEGEDQIVEEEQFKIDEHEGSLGPSMDLHTEENMEKKPRSEGHDAYGKRILTSTKQPQSVQSKRLKSEAL